MKDDDLIRLYEWAKRDQRRVETMQATIAGVLAVASLALIATFIAVWVMNQ